MKVESLRRQRPETVGGRNLIEAETETRNLKKGETETRDEEIENRWDRRPEPLEEDAVNA